MRSKPTILSANEHRLLGTSSSQYGLVHKAGEHARLRQAFQRGRIAETAGVAEVDLKRHVLTRDGEGLEIGAKELELLRFLIAHRGEVVLRDTLLAEVWGYPQDIVTRTVDNVIVRLRKKIEPDPARPRYLLTVHGSGYKLVED